MSQLEIRKWSVRPRGNGTLNIIETDLVGIDRVLFNLRHGVSENDAQAISVARESLALLRDIENADLFEFTASLEINKRILEIKSRMKDILGKANPDSK